MFSGEVCEYYEVWRPLCRGFVSCNKAMQPHFSCEDVSNRLGKPDQYWVKKDRIQDDVEGPISEGGM